jgi:hypothetical protein
MTGEESLQRAEALLERLERARAELEQLADDEKPEAAIEVLSELAEIAKEVEAALERARREAESERS